MMVPMEISLARKQVELFTSSDSVIYLTSITSCVVPRFILIKAYNWLVSRKIIQPIEEMSQEHKLNLWETAKEFTKGKLTTSESVDFARILYTIEYFLNETV